MAHTNSWDETNPTDTLTCTSIDNEITKLRLDIRERAAVDHNLASSDSGEATKGYHKQITFEDDLSSDPTVSGDETVIYPMKLSAGSNVVPFFRNSVSGICRVLLGDANFKIWLYTNTAPVGMKATSSPPSDRALAAVGGSTYTTAGANAGTWTISGLTHSHTHSCTTGTPYPDNPMDEGGGSDSLASKNHTHTLTTDADATAVNHSPVWRASAAVCKLYETDLTV